MGRMASGATSPLGSGHHGQPRSLQTALESRAWGASGSGRQPIVLRSHGAGIPPDHTIRDEMSLISIQEAPRMEHSSEAEVRRNPGLSST